jgi:hypothetical protein
MTPTADPYSGTGGGIGGASYIPPANLSWIVYNVPDKTTFNPNQSVWIYFNVTTIGGGLSTYGGSKIELWNGTTNLINSSIVNKSILSSTTNLSIWGNMSNYKSIIAKFYIYNSSDPTDFNLVYTKEFKSLNVSEGTYSLSAGLKSWGNITGSTLAESYSNAWWVFFILCVVIGIFCFTTGVEYTNPMGIGIGLVVVLWILSYGNLLYINGLANEFMNKYSLAMISTLFGAGYLISVWRERG